LLCTTRLLCSSRSSDEPSAVSRLTEKGVVGVTVGGLLNPEITNSKIEPPERPTEKNPVPMIYPLATITPFREVVCGEVTVTLEGESSRG
jgi:hypothetical protein